MSQNDRNRPRRDVRRVQGQSGDRKGSQPRPPQARPPLHAVPAGGQATAVERPHPNPTTYIQIAVVLAAITGAEVGVYYLEAVKSILVPILLLLSALKF